MARRTGIKKEIRSFLLKEIEGAFTTKDVVYTFIANPNTVRRILTELKKEGIIARIDKKWSVIAPTQIFFRKYVSELAYCNGKRRQLYALTFEDNQINRESYLLDIIEAYYDQKCGNFIETGYSQMEYYQKVTQSKIYPLYEVGML